MKTMKVKELIKLKELFDHYTVQSIDPLVSSIENEGLKEKPVIKL